MQTGAFRLVRRLPAAPDTPNAPSSPLAPPPPPPGKSPADRLCPRAAAARWGSPAHHVTRPAQGQDARDSSVSGSLLTSRFKINFTFYCSTLSPNCQKFLGSSKLKSCVFAEMCSTFNTWSSRAAQPSL